MKDAAQNNIVMMSEYEKPRPVPGLSSGAFLLNDCRDMAAFPLVQALSSMMDKAVDEFFNLSEQTTHHEMRNLYMDAMTLARDKRSLIEQGFRKQFVQGFNREARRDLSLGGMAGAKNTWKEGGFNPEELSLVAPDDLEESLASVNIANSIHEICGEELFGIEKRMGVLLNDPELAQTNNPLGPEVIGKSFMGAMKELDCPVKVKLLLVTMFNKHMPGQIKGVYRDINQHLVEKGILEKIRAGMRRRSDGVGASISGAAGKMDASGEAGLFATLQQLLMQNASGGAFQAGQSGAVPAQSLSVVNALTRLQQEQLERLAGSPQPQHLRENGGALDTASFADGYANVLRGIKNSAVAGTMGHVDAMTLDIVAMLFDYILDDRRIPDAMKALISRLQIPVLKVAMLDKSFFSQKSHPARKLLDELADISIGWNEAEGHQGGLYKKVDDLMQRILNEFNDKVGIFADVLQDLELYLAEEKKHADELTGLSAQVVHHREQEEIAKIMAHDEIRRRIHSPQLPDVIRNFLVGCWESVLAAAYVQAGEDGEPWNRAIATMDELVWSVEPKRVPDDRKQLVSLLPALLKRLQDGMVLVDLPDAERDQFFSKLIKCHAGAIKSGLYATVQEGVASENVIPSGFVVDEFEAEDSAQIAPQGAESADFTVVVLPREDVTPDPAFIQSMAAGMATDDDSGWQTITIGDMPWQGAPESASDDFDAMVKRLKRGTWIEFELENGESSRVKLAWVSPLKGLYLFTNRLGERAVSITPAGLAEKFRNGYAQIIDDIALVDRAVNNLMERLKRTAVMVE